MRKRLLKTILISIFLLTSVGRIYAVDIDWKNDWSSNPATNAQFYLCNKNGLFVRSGVDGSSAMVVASQANIWTYNSSSRLTHNGYYLRFQTNSATTAQTSTGGVGNYITVTFDISNGLFQLYHKVSGIQLYYLYANNTKLTDEYRTSSTSNYHEWLLVNQTQYNNHIALDFYDTANSQVNGYSAANLPNAIWGEVKDYINSATDYLNYSGWLSTTDKSTSIKNATTQINAWLSKYSNRSEISAAYIQAISDFNTFESNYPELANGIAKSDLTNARTALEAATSVSDINAAKAILKKGNRVTFDESLSSEIAFEGGVVSNNWASAQFGSIVYSSNNLDVLTISGNTFTPIASGEVTVTATVDGGTEYYTVTDTRRFTVTSVALPTPTITWGQSITMTALETLDIADYVTAELEDGTKLSGITYSSSDPTIVSVDGSVLTAHKSGEVTITASLAEKEGEFNGANATTTFTVAKAPTHIVWTQTIPALNDRSSAPVTLEAYVADASDNAIEGVTVTYSTSKQSVADIEGSQLTPRGGGETVITASFAGNEIYAAAANVTKNVSITGYSVPSAWVNDWASAPSAGSQFYIYNTTNDKFLQEGHGEESRSAFVEAGVATLWVYANSQRIESTVNSNNYIANRTNQASTDGTGNIREYRFEIQNGKYQIRSASGIQYDLFNNGGIFDGYNNGSHYEWWFISTEQYDFRLTNAPKAVEEYLYAEKYAAVVGPMRTALANVCANTTSDFAAANAQIASLEQAFDDYLEALAAINTFEQEYASKTPDTTTPVSDIAAARAALREAANSSDIENALKKLRAFDEIIIEKQPVDIIANGGGDVASGIQASAISTISYASDNAEVLTISEDGKTITPVAVGSTTITLRTATSQTHYAAMPIQTAEVSVKDAFVLDPTSTEGYTTGEQSKVILKRTLLDGYSTIALPFDTTVEAITGNSEDKAYTLCNVGYKQGEGYTFYFKEVEGGELQAGKPYVISVASEVVNPQWEETTIGELSPGTVTCGAWSFIANFEAGKSMKDLYGVVNSQNPNKVNKVMKGGTNASLGAFTAYFCLAEQDGGSTKATGSSVAPSAAGSSAAVDLPANAIPLFTVKE